MTTCKQIAAQMAASITFVIAAEAAGHDYCPKDHCAAVNEEMNEFCIANGLAGKPYLVLGPSGVNCLCDCSCVTGDTLLTLSDHQRRAINAVRQGHELLSPLSREQKAPVDARLKSDVVGSRLLRLSFEGGAQLTVSLNHPFILPDEVVVSAEKLKAGDRVLGEGWNPLMVTSTEEVLDFSGEMHNVIISRSSARATDHLVSTNGVLSGDWLLQVNNDAVEVSIALRTSMLDLFEPDR